MKKQKIQAHNPLLWGTIGYLFLFIFRPFEYWEWIGAYHIERIYMIGLIVVLIFSSGTGYKHHPVVSVLLSFFGVMCFSILIAYRPDKAWDQVWEYFKLLVLFFTIIFTVRTKEDFTNLVIAFLAITGLYMGKSLWEFLFHDHHVYRMGIKRLIGIDITYGDPNTFSATILYSLPFAVALWKTTPSNRIKWGVIGYLILAMTCISLTGSRAGYVSFLFFLLLLWIRGKMKVLGALGIVLVLSIGWYSMPETYQKRFETIYDSSINQSAQESAEGRIEGLKNGIKLFKLSPVWGWGADNFPFAVKVIGVDDEMRSHNLYGQLLAELGVLGVIPMALLCILIFRTPGKILRQDKTLKKNGDMLYQAAIACSNTLLLLLFQGNFGHNLYRYTWILISAITVLAAYLSTQDAYHPVPKIVDNHS